MSATSPPPIAFRRIHPPFTTAPLSYCYCSVMVISSSFLHRAACIITAARLYADDSSSKKILDVVAMNSLSRRNHETLECVHRQTKHIVVCTFFISYVLLILLFHFIHAGNLLCGFCNYISDAKGKRENAQVFCSL